MLWKLNEGISYVFETDDAPAYSKTVPSGAKMCDVQMVGGKSMVFNQMLEPLVDGKSYINNRQRGSAVCVDGVIEYTATDVNSALQFITNQNLDHTYMFIADIKSNDETSIEFGIHASAVSTSWGNFADNEYKRFFAIDKPVQTSIYYPRVMIRGNSGTLYCKNMMAFDLTAMFGAGNEPTAEQFEAMFPADYYPHSEPTIISADVESVDVIGRNLFDANELLGFFQKIHLTSTSGYRVEWACSNSSDYLLVSGVFKDNTAYTFLFYGKNSLNTAKYSNLAIIYTDGTRTKIPSFEKTGEMSYSIFTSNKSKTVKELRTIWESYGTILELDKCSICVGETFCQYKKESYPLPQLDLKSAGSVYDEIDFENKKHIQRVQRVDLGTLNWTVQTGAPFNCFRATLQGVNSSSYPEILCERYETQNVVYSDTSRRDKTISGRINYDRIYVLDSSYSDAMIFKAAMSGVYLYYELAEPIETDISALLDDSFESIEVEGGGTIEFKQSGDYRLPVPNREEYIVSVAEAGGGV